jgi:arylformamidase
MKMRLLIWTAHEPRRPGRAFTGLLRCGVLLGFMLGTTLPVVQPAQAGLLRDKRHERQLSRSQAEAADQGLSDAGEGQGEPIPSHTTVLRKQPYGPDKLQRYDVYLPPKPSSRRAGTLAPVMFMVHGGAWSIGDMAHGNVTGHKLAHWLAQGVVFVSVNYRLVPDVTPAQQRDDIAQALAVVQKQAEGWGGDRHRFVLMGHSAGAHLVALLSADPGVATSLGASRWLGSILLDSAALDLVQIMQAPRHFRFYDQAFGKDPQQWAGVSPFHQLQTGLAPMLAVCSSRRSDSCDQARRFADQARTLGDTVSVLPQDLSHMDINAELGVPSNYTDQVDRFLNGLGGWSTALSPSAP